MGCARPPCIRTSRRFRRRGPRSSDALLRRRHRRDLVVSPILPQGGGPCKSGPDPPLFHADVTIFHCNIRGFRSNSPELEARLMIMEKKPCIICLTETWLNKSVGAPTLNGYVVIGRRDRSDGRIGGGVIIFAVVSLIDVLTTVLISKCSERIWCIFHSSSGAFLLCGWYRPPIRGEIETIKSFNDEFEQLRHQVVSTLIFGDFNIHQIR